MNFGREKNLIMCVCVCEREGASEKERERERERESRGCARADSLACAVSGRSSSTPAENRASIPNFHSMHLRRFGDAAAAGMSPATVAASSAI